MAVELNHTIISASDREQSARFLVDILGLEPPSPYGPFLVVQVANDVSLDIQTSSQPITPQHYAFLVSEEEFDEIFERIRQRGLDFWARPGHRGPGEINRRDGGRGLYFDDVDGHSLEILTRPYGSGD